MIPGLQKVYAILADEIDDSVLFGETSRPGTAWKVFERFRFSYALERIALNCLDDI